MRTHFMKNQSVKRNQHVSTPAIPASICADGLISELVYNEDHPGMTQLLLLPLLQQLGTQSRWQLWLTSQQKLSRDWLLRSGLPLDKVMQSPYCGTITTVEAMIKALQTGNYSVVLGWLADEISETERKRLQQAAKSGQALGLIMRSECNVLPSARPLHGLRIQSSLYH
ncbi:SOS-induced cell division inhibitor SulA [Erwinia pyrifoliae]|uniref:Cell division inhibitor SulA n=1 Tax=Erwinia pyrifoliae TaxID=79967 RepID=A0ABY5XDC0_ERWPY|nr:MULTISPECIES: SOS-induced cell division inhibitor SulA [Erwinia]ADP12169.1 Cell division inhibitor [Erwinia sp. Ejp617]MCT2388567.1 cell division inhibitor SulA [Erwinia pyrifoliae]MCU8586736.1 cell division inhibitor SulA [Erwinia pyrifoliae]UWS31737.1 cell division inhibitor SulA [Erwinia pyrifoliae]UWS35413.1 cell division inhibitor SulA [Erwinia pyrifoliae]